MLHAPSIDLAFAGLFVLFLGIYCWRYSGSPDELGASRFIILIGSALLILALVAGVVSSLLV